MRKLQKNLKAKIRKMNLKLPVRKIRINHIYIKESTKGSGTHGNESWVKVRLKIRVVDVSQDPLPESAQQNNSQFFITEKKTEGLFPRQDKVKGLHIRRH